MPIGIKKGAGSSVLNNCIERHESSIACFEESGEEKYESLRNKLKKFKRDENYNRTISDHYYEWIREFKHLDTDAKALSKTIDNILKSKRFLIDFVLPDDDILDQNTFQEVKRSIQCSETNVEGYKREIKNLVQCLNNSFGVSVESKKKSKGRDAALADSLLKFRESLLMEGKVLETEYMESSNEMYDYLQKIFCKEPNINIENHGQMNVQLPDTLEESIKELKKFSNSIATTNGKQKEIINIKIDSLMKDLQTEFYNIQHSCYDNTFNDSSKSFDTENIEWDVRCQSILVKEMKSWKTALPRVGNKLSVVLERIATQTDKSVKNCAQQWQRMEDLRLQKRKEKVAINNRSRRYGDMTKKALSEVENLRLDIAELLSMETKERLNQALSSEQRERLVIFRQAKDQAVELREENDARVSAKEEAEHQQAEARRAIRRMQNKAILMDYNEKKEKVLKNKAVEQIRRQQQEQMARLLRLSTNGERVRFRMEEWEDKIKQQEKAAIIESQAQRKRMDKLIALAATVPYYSNIINKKSNLHKSTAARINDVYESCDLADFQQGLTKLRTFTNEKVFSDPKFRLAHALHEKGIANSAYSHAVVKRIIPREVPKTTGIEPGIEVI